MSDLNSYQKEALRTFIPTGRESSWSMAAMGLAGEAGEAVDLLKKHLYHGHNLDQGKLTRELGDILWYVAVLSHLNGIDLADVAAQNVVKLRARYPEGFDPERSRARKAGDK